LIGGYAGKILRVNLSSKEIRQWRVDEALLRRFIGGSGLAAKILFDETGPGVRPFDPENLLIFMTGPVTATKVPLSGRYQVVSKSPLTGIYGESDSGGSWGPELKKAGFDGIIISGQASKPVYLWISDGHAEIREAGHLWGMDTYETDEAVKEETDEKAVVSCIGPAGERLARIAGIINDGKHGRAAARCGLGAVMGSKRLKAISVRGTGTIEVAEPDALEASVKEAASSIVENAKAGRKARRNSQVKPWLGPSSAEDTTAAVA